jgi:type IX secretion system PorP/SprF family membrane protein
MTSFAQDPQFSQFYANPLFLNPALAGTTECGRINLNYRNQWPGLSNAFSTYNASYDQNLPGINSGFGVLLMNDQQGDGALSTVSASAFYVYKLKVSEPIMVNFGVKASYYQEKLDWAKLTFADQINSATGEISNSTSETPPSSFSISTVDFSVGALMSYYDMFFVGVAADHITQPQMSYYEDPNSKLNMKITTHASVNINLTQGMLGGYDEDDIMLQPSILYMQQGKFHQLNAGIYVNKYPFVIGAYYRHNFQNPDAVIALVGLTFNKLRFGYSYDVTMSNVGGKAGGAHEISLAWDFCIYKQQKRRRIRAIKSPSF